MELVNSFFNFYTLSKDMILNNLNCITSNYKSNYYSKFISISNFISRLKEQTGSYLNDFVKFISDNLNNIIIKFGCFYNNSISILKEQTGSYLNDFVKFIFNNINKLFLECNNIIIIKDYIDFFFKNIEKL
jgi:hypothetical protein